MYEVHEVTKIILVDSNDERRVEVYRVAREIADVLPIASLDEIGANWPERAWLIIHADDARHGDVLQKMAENEKFYPILVYSEGRSVALIVSVLRQGAQGFVNWPCGAAELKKALFGCHRWTRRESDLMIQQFHARTKVCTLSPRERQVTQLACGGASNKEIGQQLEISPRTVEVHRAKALIRLVVRNTVEAARIWMLADGAQQLLNRDHDEEEPSGVTAPGASARWAA
ncbi:MAG: LuxR C-terminal-related transcriptional regulator [Erythrobacter sp.]|nr:LuxR C-terminal-related transcriptional regulator [Erythrobacter sp.]